MQETRKICTTENGSIWATPENLPFLKYEIYHLFPYSCGSKVPKWKCAHILLCKKYKNCLKLLNIADLQPPDWIQRKKTPCTYPHDETHDSIKTSERPLKLKKVAQTNAQQHPDALRSVVILKNWFQLKYWFSVIQLRLIIICWWI